MNTLRYALTWMLAVTGVAVIILTVASLADDDPPSLPQPPAGYQYCTTGDTIGFCTREPVAR